MPTFSPFPAWRYAESVPLDRVVAPPYDVLSAADVAELAARDPRNIVHVDVPSGLPGSYDCAAALLRSWMASGDLVQDASPTFSIYRMSFIDAAGRSRSLVAALGALTAGGVAAGVLPHERTTPKASTDRLDLTRACRANLSPVWGLSLASGLSALLDEPGEPFGSVSVDGVMHSVERVADLERVAQISACVASAEVLIADGHHRYAVAGAYRDEVSGAGGSGATLALVGELVADQLSIEAIHRLYSGLSYDSIIAALAVGFEIVPFSAGESGLGDAAVLAAMRDLGRLVLIGPGAARAWLVPRRGAFDRVRSLDGAWLESLLDGLAVEVSYQAGVADIVAAVLTGTAEAGVLIRPVGIEEIERTAEEGLLMPPKSTYFTPKPRTGFVIRDLSPRTAQQA